MINESSEQTHLTVCFSYRCSKKPKSFIFLLLTWDNKMVSEVNFKQVCNLLRVTTPSNLMMLGWSNCPMMLASLRKSRLCFSVYPALSVLMATQISFLDGSLNRPLHTSPNSPDERRLF